MQVEIVAELALDVADGPVGGDEEAGGGNRPVPAQAGDDTCRMGQGAIQVGSQVKLVHGAAGTVAESGGLGNGEAAGGGVSPRVRGRAERPGRLGHCSG